MTHPSIPSPRRLFPSGVALAFTVAFAMIVGAPSSRAQIAFGFDSTELPPDTALFGMARIDVDDSGVNSCVHLTDPVGGAHGHFRVSNIGEGKPVRSLRLQWRSLIGGGNAADGYSVNWANDLPATPDYFSPGEEGGGSGLSVTVDTFDNGGGEAPGIEIRWKSQVVASAAIPNEDPGNGGTFLRRNEFVNAELTVDAKGVAQFTYDSVTISAQLSGWKGLTGADLLFSARTGGATDRHWIDDVTVTSSLFKAGTYNGLIVDRGGTHAGSGFFTVKVTPTGTFSGYQTLGGIRRPISGRFDPVQLGAVLPAAAPGEAQLEFRLVDKNVIVGSAAFESKLAYFRADRQVFDKVANPATNQAGTFVMRIDPGAGPSQPNGWSYASVTVDTAGMAKVTGSLADGTKFTQKVGLSQKGQIPLYAALYAGQGSIFGWSYIWNSDVTRARLKWSRNAGAPGTLYPNGFELFPLSATFPYVPPAIGTPVLPSSVGLATFFGGPLSSPFTSRFGITANSIVVPLGTDRFTTKFNLKTGLFTGSVIAPGTTTVIKFTGAVAPNDGSAYGYFIGGNLSGSVILAD